MTRFLAVMALVFVAGLALSGATSAHELRPGFLEVRQTASDTYDVRFKVPARGDLRLGLYVRFPQSCSDTKTPRTEFAGAAFLEHFVITCRGGLGGGEISIDGLASTFTDVVARVALADGSVQAARLTPDRPNFTVLVAPTWLDTAWTYFLLGVEHILFGIDHLLFVLALLLLVRDPWMLVKTITAFTVAHSITLAAATLGWAAPQAPVEAVIALSIVFVAAEVIRQRRHSSDLANRAPWLVAFAFGLLHGFGFAGALKEIGLSQSDVPLALATFNLGIEAGQLLFVVAVLGVRAIVERLVLINLAWLRNVTAYGIGSLAAVWFVQRVVFMV